MELCSRIKAVSEKNVFLKFLLEFCHNDCDDWLWWLLHLARMFSSKDNFTEFIYAYGPSGTGKDAMAACLETAFGDKEYGAFGGGLTNEFFVVDAHGKKRDKEACTPFLNALEKCRVCIVPEHPSDRCKTQAATLDMDALKMMTEQAGAKVTSRGCGSNPSRSSPCYEIVIFSNFGPRPSLQDKASKGRLNAFECRNRFTTQPVGGETQVQGDLKGRIKKGLMNPHMFWAAAPFYPFFELPVFGREILRSPNVKEASSNAFGGDDGGDEGEVIKSLILEHFEPCTVQAAMTQEEAQELFLKALQGTAVALAPRRSDPKTQMINAGFVFDRVSSKQYCGFKHFPATATCKGGFSPVRAKGALHE